MSVYGSSLNKSPEQLNYERDCALQYCNVNQCVVSDFRFCHGISTVRMLLPPIDALNKNNNKAVSK